MGKNLAITDKECEKLQRSHFQMPYPSCSVPYDHNLLGSLYAALRSLSIKPLAKIFSSFLNLAFGQNPPKSGPVFSYLLFNSSLSQSMQLSLP
jgi:hypothetical protein